MAEAAKQKARGSKQLVGAGAKPSPRQNILISRSLDATETERALIRRAYSNPSPSLSESISDTDSSPSLTPKTVRSRPSLRSPPASPPKWKDSLQSETHSRSPKPSVTSKSPKLAPMTPVLPPSPRGLKKTVDSPEVKAKVAARSTRKIYDAPTTSPSPKNSPKKSVKTPPGTKTSNRALGKKAKGGSQSPVESTGRGRGNRSSVPRSQTAGIVGGVSPQSSLSDVTRTSEEFRGPVLDAEASFSSAEGASIAELQGLSSESEAMCSSNEFGGLVLGRETQAGSAVTARPKEKQGLSDSRMSGDCSGLVSGPGPQTDGVESMLCEEKEGLSGNAEPHLSEEAPPVGGYSRDAIAGSQTETETDAVRAQCKEDELMVDAVDTLPEALSEPSDRPDRPPNDKPSSECSPPLGKPASFADVTFRPPSRSEGSPSSRLRLLRVTDSGVTVEDQSSGLSPENLQRTARELVGPSFLDMPREPLLAGGGMKGENEPPGEIAEDVQQGDLSRRGTQEPDEGQPLRGEVFAGDTGPLGRKRHSVWSNGFVSQNDDRLGVSLSSVHADVSAKSALNTADMSRPAVDVSSRDADASTAAEIDSASGQGLSVGDLQTLHEQNPNPRLNSRLSLSPSRLGHLAEATLEAEVLRGPDGGVGIGPQEAVLRGTKSDTATMLADRRHSFEDELEMGGWRGHVLERLEGGADVAAAEGAAGVAATGCADVAARGQDLKSAREGFSSEVGRSEGMDSQFAGREMGLRTLSPVDAETGRLDIGNGTAVANDTGVGASLGSEDLGADGGELHGVEEEGCAREADEAFCGLTANASRGNPLAEPGRREADGDLQLEDVLQYKAQMKQKFARLLLGNDLSGGSRGVSPALAVSNAIADLAAAVFGDVCALEPLMGETRLLWTREIGWLVAPANHVVEMRPGWIVTPEGKKTEVMQRMPRGDIQASLPVLRKLDGLLLNTLDTLVDLEYSYGNKRREKASETDTWWRPKAEVPPGGLSGEGLRKLRGQKEVATNVYAVATAINAQTLAEIEIPEDYWESLPKSSKAALGEDLYRALTDEIFDVDATVTLLAIDTEQAAADIASDLEAAVHLWQRKIGKRAQDEPGNSLRVRMESMAGHSTEQRERWAQRASALLQMVLGTFPTRPRTRLEECKVEYNKDVGRAILESYSRVLGSVASDLLAGFTHVLELHEEAYSLRKALRASLDYQDFQDSPTSMLVNPAPIPPGGSRPGSSSAGEDSERDLVVEGGKFAPRRNPLQQWVVLEGRSAQSPQSPARFADARTSLRRAT